MSKRETYETLTAAIRTRAWARAFVSRHARAPNDDELARVVDKLAGVNHEYITKAVKDMNNEHASEA